MKKRSKAERFDDPEDRLFEKSVNRSLSKNGEKIQIDSIKRKKGKRQSVKEKKSLFWS